MRALQRAISAARAAGVGCVRAVSWEGGGSAVGRGRVFVGERGKVEWERTVPKPPAFDTAEASSAYPTHCMPPCTTGTASFFLVS